MKSAAILLLFLSATAEAAERVISTSPDGRFRVVVGVEDGPAFAIRDERSSDIVATDDSFAGGGGYGYSDTAASWSPDGQMVILQVPHFYRSGPAVYAVLRWGGKQFSEVRLPKNAVPLRWAANDTLVCRMGTEAILQLSPDKTAFRRNDAKRTQPK